MAYERLEPFGPAAVNLNTGKITSLLMNIYSKKGARRITAQEASLGDFGITTEPQSVDEQKFMLISMVKAFGGKIVKRIKNIGSKAVDKNG